MDRAPLQMGRFFCFFSCAFQFTSFKQVVVDSRFVLLLFVKRIFCVCQRPLVVISLLRGSYEHQLRSVQLDVLFIRYVNWLSRGLSLFS